MRFIEAARLAWDALRANKLRSGLTMLGVVIGVMSVVVLVAIGSGARQEVTSGVESLGSNILFVGAGDFGGQTAPTSFEFDLGDVERIGSAIGDPSRVAALTAAGEVVRAGSVRTTSNIQGVNETVPHVFDRPLDRGAFFDRVDVEVRRRVAVLGAATAAELFPDVDPVGRQLTIGGVRFRVVGVVGESGDTLGFSTDNVVYVPITAAQRMFGTTRVDGIAVRAPGPDQIEAEQQIIAETLADAHPDQQFEVVSQEEILGVVGDILSILTLVLASIAGISLLVGGVGVMNIMLVSVSERTREVGLRKAVGARTRDVLRQFLLEAVALTVTGGVIGILLGSVAAFVVSVYSPVPATITWWSVTLAFGVSVAVGVFFGVYPARKAARMQPIAALRYE